MLSILSAPELAGDSASGSLPLGDMSRLRGMLAAPAVGDLSYAIRAERSPGGRTLLTIDVAATLPLVCQRCLSSFELPVATSQRFYVVAQGETPPAQPPADAPDCEPLESAGFRLADFLEEELMLAAPLSPRHDLSDCPAARHIAA